MPLFKKDAMISAAQQGDIEKMTDLLNKGMDPNLEHYEQTPLTEAISFYQPRMVSLLISRGATITGSHITKAIGTECAETVAVLLDNSEAGTVSHTHKAIENYNLEILSLLYDHGITTDSSGLRRAVSGGHLEVVTWLLENDADLLKNINAQDGDGSTALHRAAEKGHAKIAAYLLSRGADPDIENTKNRTALSLAMEENNKEVEAVLTPVTKNVVAPLPPAMKMESGWKKMPDKQQIALVTVAPEIGYCITEIFNFQSRRCLTIVRNIGSNAEAVETKNFDDITDKTQLEAAVKALNARGGKVNTGDISGMRKGGLEI
jgi:ankyrin repeat protein